ncbi:MAG: hypothetical protein JW834_02195 [Candidatus Diapherotrites archaeon]|nr:hypothetical protein [Candidatus Diapherotrites archaeon]
MNDDMIELRLRVLELSYKYNKPIPEVLDEFMRIGIQAQPKDDKKAKKK